MSPDNVIFHWKQFLQEASRVLVEVQQEEEEEVPTQQPQGAAGTSRTNNAGNNGGSSAAAAATSNSQQRIADLVDKYAYLVKTAQTLNPGEVLCIPVLQQR
jgi:hypothetical protein